MKGMITMLDNLKLPNETIDKCYDDLLHPAASETGKLLARIPQVINAALAPLDCWIAERQYHVDRTKKLLEENLKNADPEKIVPPEPYVAIPAIQAISYAMDSDELRTLYANLLAKSIYLDTKDSVHPAFTEIIKNLSPVDCRVFDSIMKTNYQEIAYYEMRVGTIGETSYHVAFQYITPFTFDSLHSIASSIDNLSRCNLINPEDFTFVDDSYYLKIRETQPFKDIVSYYSNNPNNQELRPYKKSIKSTELGKRFYNICCMPL